MIDQLFFQHVFRESTLNGLMGLTKEHWAEARATLTTLLSRFPS